MHLSASRQYRDETKESPDLEGVNLTAAQWIYLGVAVLYAGTFLLFLRLFVWKRYADKNWWSRRPDLSLATVRTAAAAQGQALPKISLFIPARDETAVIARTIEHLSRLEYPPDRYEIVVVTDDKELRTAARDRSRCLQAALGCLARTKPWPAEPPAEALLLGLLTRLSLAEWTDLPSDRTPAGASAFLTLPPDRQRQVLLEFITEIWRAQGRISRGRLYNLLRRAGGAESPSHLDHLYIACLTLSLPALLVAAEFRSLPGAGFLSRLTTAAARAHHPVSQKVIAALAQTVTQHIWLRLRRLERKGRLEQTLHHIWCECFPSTPDLVAEKAEQFSRTPGLPSLRHVIVPFDFDGQLSGRCLGYEVPSTKGRALNYALTSASPDSEMYGFYDAESRPDPKVLLYIAWRRLQGGEGFRIAQGPVYQVRNWYRVGPLCKVAGLYQSISHKYYMPYLFRRIPFNGGTNYFIDARLIHNIGGFDNTVLTEDMELGARAWLLGDAWPEYIPYASTEQSPPTFRAFFRQRLRWGSGYLQVYEKLRQDRTTQGVKKERLLRQYFWLGQAQWFFYQFLALMPLCLFALVALGLVDTSGVPVSLRWVMNSFSIAYLGFTFYALWAFSDHIEPVTTSHGHRRLASLAGAAQLLALPVTAFFLPTPYSSAMFLHWFRWQPKDWMKTPRTRE